MKRTLLIDADLLAYRSSSANQRTYDWNGDGVKSVAADLEGAKRYAEEEIRRLADTLEADEVTVCLSDDFTSFRKDRIDPSYKALRPTLERPEYLYDMKSWLGSEYDTELWPTLEADDVMGILATDPARTDERIIVSADKDLMTVPGKLYRPPVTLKGRLIRKGLMLDISPLDAMRFHFWQTVVGDTTDGFPGAPGVGPKSEYAADILASESEEEAWDNVLMAFGSKRLSEDEALVQARLARILQHSDWDGRTVRLWLPPAWEEPDAED